MIQVTSGLNHPLIIANFNRWFNWASVAGTVEISDTLFKYWTPLQDEPITIPNLPEMGHLHSFFAETAYQPRKTGTFCEAPPNLPQPWYGGGIVS